MCGLKSAEPGNARESINQPNNQENEAQSNAPRRCRPRCRSLGTRPRTWRRGCGPPPPRTRSWRTRGGRATGRGDVRLCVVPSPCPRCQGGAHQSNPPASSPSHTRPFSAVPSSTTVSVTSSLRVQRTGAANHHTQSTQRPLPREGCAWGKCGREGGKGVGSGAPPAAAARDRAVVSDRVVQPRAEPPNLRENGETGFSCPFTWPGRQKGSDAGRRSCPGGMSARLGEDVRRVEVRERREQPRESPAGEELLLDSRLRTRCPRTRDGCSGGVRERQGAQCGAVRAWGKCFGGVATKVQGAGGERAPGGCRGRRRRSRPTSQAPRTEGSAACAGGPAPRRREGNCAVSSARGVRQGDRNHTSGRFSPRRAPRRPRLQPPRAPRRAGAPARPRACPPGPPAAPRTAPAPRRPAAESPSAAGCCPP